uniref:Uncharacterized protein n=1 Tax=Knipowitschia caucasica TaxID=637954 RepID=A0AAV2MC11_KNICA
MPNKIPPLLAGVKEYCVKNAHSGREQERKSQRLDLPSSKLLEKTGVGRHPSKEAELAKGTRSQTWGKR